MVVARKAPAARSWDPCPVASHPILAAIVRFEKSEDEIAKLWLRIQNVERRMDDEIDF